LAEERGVRATPPVGPDDAGGLAAPTFLAAGRTRLPRPVPASRESSPRPLPWIDLTVSTDRPRHPVAGGRGR